MSGVYIKGMDMPINCDNCDLMAVEGEYGEPTCPFGLVIRCASEKHPDCPLIEIPPHGDLIDRDALRASIGESIDECHKWADEVDKDTMMYARISQSLGTFVECSLRAKAAPTIIPAEEGET